MAFSAARTASPTPVVNESWLIFLMGLIQFINIVDFMMVMPLGPDFARALDIPTAHIGYVGGTYTLAAAVSGFAGALFLDRFYRKTVLLASLAGLVISTAAAALAWDLPSLLAARIVAGIFGGTISASSVAMIADYIPPERRGAAMGKVLGAFAVASVLGVPFGLELAARFHWYTPFLVLSGLGTVVGVFLWLKTPSGLTPAQTPWRQNIKQMAQMMRTPLAQMALGLLALGMLAGFMLIPNISAHIQLNLGYPREKLGLLYLAGGAVSFFSMRLAGKMVDRYSATWVSSICTLGLVMAIALGFIFYPTPVPVIVIFTLFMVTMSGRNVAGQTLTSEVPPPHNRAAYMSLQFALTHLAGAFGAFLSSAMLVEENGRLLGMPRLALMTLAIALLIPVLTWRVEQALHARGK